MPKEAPGVKRKPTMRVFVYEYLTATGIGRDPDAPDHSMYLEGRAMRNALAEDFARIPGVEVFVFPDHPDPTEAGWSVIVAPEFDGILADVVQSIGPMGGDLLGPIPEAIRLTSDKLALAEHWRANGVRTPATSDREPTPCEAFPVVWKPQDGAGSTDTFLIRDRFELATALAARDPNRPMIVQEFVPGRAVSVAFLCGPHGAAVKPGFAGDRSRGPRAAVKPGFAGDRSRGQRQVPLVPTFQRLSDDGRFTYQGGELPIPPALAERAVKLAREAVECVPGLLGYAGVDLVLGDAADGSRDYAIEINPRLTTSYIGLRALAEFNIAEAMLTIAQGEDPGELKWKPGRVQFCAGGMVEMP